MPSFNSWVKPAPLCGITIVIVETAAEPLFSLNSSVGFLCTCVGDDELVTEPLMLPFNVIGA